MIDCSGRKQQQRRSDIPECSVKVFNAQRISWFNQAIKTGLQIESEAQRPTIYEVLIEPRLEKAFQEGFERGFEQGFKRGIEKGELIGQIRTLQKVLQQPIESKEDLLLLSPEDLQLRAQQLLQLFTTRPR
ncbi:MAG: hypothetical protein ACKOEO_18390 [Planctomycetaceae bacterium]